MDLNKFDPILVEQIRQHDKIKKIEKSKKGNWLLQHGIPIRYADQIKNKGPLYSITIKDLTEGEVAQLANRYFK